MQPSIPQTTELIRAAQRGDGDAIQQYVAAGGDINATESGYSALMKAVLFGHEETSQLVLKLGGNPDLQDQNGKTIFFYDKCVPKIFKAALEKSANPNIQEKSGKTILTYLTYYRSCDSKRFHIALLLKRGAKVDIPDKDGKTALDYAANTWLEKLFKMNADELEKVIASYR